MAHHRELLDHRLQRAGRPVDRCNRLARPGTSANVLHPVGADRPSLASSLEILAPKSVGAFGSRRCHMPPLLLLALIKMRKCVSSGNAM